MEYTALYRKFRSLKFSEMVGQDHITKTLKNQIISNRVGHAYLFNGTRGTGKTSAAKILARAVNCLNPQDGEPCNSCEICKSALSSSLTDIVEMDAASNNSVEDIRQIRDEVNFLPTLAKYRVYIIDEVHMLSTGAFNALLKTLEEPPEHVKFILATTEPQKLPATILSRCQKFDFKKISNADIIRNLERVCKESNIEYEKNALEVIAILAEGSARDSLSILERCIQDGETNISADKVKELVGIPKVVQINKIVSAICEYDISKLLDAIEEIMSQGKDLSNVLWEIVKYIKDILIYKTSKKIEIYNEEEKKQIIDLAEKFSKQRLIRLIYELSQLENNLKTSMHKTILFQANLIRLCDNENMQVFNNQENEDIISKLNSLEKKIKLLENNSAHINRNTNVVVTNNEPTYVTKNPDMKIPILQNKIDTSNLKEIAYWPEIVNDLRKNGKIVLYTNLINTVAKEINDITIGIEFKGGITPFGKSILEKSENILELTKRVSISAGKEMNIKIIDGSKTLEELGVNEGSIKNIAKEAGIPFNEID